MSSAVLQPARPSPAEHPLYRLSVEQYHRMIEGGILTEDDRVELLEGVLVTKVGKNPPHPIAVGLLVDVFQQSLPAGYHYRSQDPITLADGEPEPDGAVVRGTRRDFPDRHPGPQDVPLVIEVSDSTLALDRGVKLRSYARARVGEYWIVNLIDRVVEVYRRPGVAEGFPKYLDPSVRKSGEALIVPVEGATPIRVDEILP